jgi:hypothetical protein
MKIGITGSRHFDNAEIINAAIKAVPAATEILTGGCTGADTIAENVAKKLGLPVRTYLPKFKTDTTTPYHPRWYLKRNEAIVDECDVLLAFFAGGKSKGTQYTVNYAKKTNKPVIIHSLQPGKAYMETKSLF